MIGIELAVKLSSRSGSLRSVNSARPCNCRWENRRHDRGDAKLTTGETQFRSTGKDGASVAAPDRHAETLSVYEGVLGPNYPTALAVRRNLADWTREARDVSAHKQLAALRGA